MIHILLRGVDEFLGKHVETLITPQISKICHVENDEVLLTCLQSMIYHGGVDQTSYHMIVLVELDEKYRVYEKEIAEYLLKASKQFSVHAHVQFTYLNGGLYERIDNTYPLFVTQSNSVDVGVDDDDDDDDDIYTGNIFADFEEKLKKNND